MKKLKLTKFSLFIISCLLILAASLALVLADTGADKTGLLTPSLEITIKQDKTVIADNGVINGDIPVDVSFSFKAPVIGDFQDGSKPDESSYVKGGDFAVFALPDAFIFSGLDSPQNLTAKDGTTIGSVVFNTAAKTMTVEFTGEIIDNPDITEINGQFHFSMSFDKADGKDVPGDYVVEVFSKDYTVNIPEKQTLVTGTNTGNADIENGVINWRVEVNSHLEGSDDSAANGKLDGCEFSDNLTAVGQYVEGSFKVSNAETSPTSIDQNILKYTFPKDTKGNQTITFQTKIPDEKKYANGQQTISNAALIMSGNLEKAKLTGQAKFTPEWIKKSFTKEEPDTDDGTYNPQGRKITWTIIANQMGETLNNAVITDKLPRGLEWKSAAYQIGTTTETINTEPTDGKYALGDISQKVTLTIVTEVTEQSPSPDKLAFTNEAFLSWENHGQIGSGKVQAGIGITALTKSAGAYVPSTHTIPWTVNLNTHKLELGGSLQILDLLVYGKKFDAEKIDDSNLNGITKEMLKNLKPAYVQKYKTGSFTGTEEDLEVEVVTLTQNEEKVADLLVVKGKSSSYIDATKPHSFTYETIVTDPDVYASNSKTSVKNTASLFSGQTRLTDAPAAATAASNMVKKTMLTRQTADSLLSGIPASNAGQGFDYIDKTAVFRIDINKNGLTDATNDVTAVDGKTLGELTFTDTLPAGWEFVKIGDNDFVLYDDADKEVSAPGGTITADGNKLTIVFSELKQHYTLFVKAKAAEDTAKKYFEKNAASTVTNTAVLKNSSFSGATDTQNVEIQSRLLSKQSDLSKENDGYLTWSVNYQPYDLDNKASHVTDVLPVGLDLRTDAMGKLDFTDNNITITEMTLQGDGTYKDGNTVSDVKSLVSYNPGARTLQFKIPDPSKAYKFTYITDITGSSGKVSNQVTLSGDAAGEPVAAERSYTISEVGASASLTRNGWIEVTLLGKEKEPLQYAEFTLYAADRKTPIRTGVTNAEGKISMRALPVGQYILRQTKAADGSALSRAEYSVTVAKDGAGKPETVIAGKHGSDSNKITITSPSEPSGGGSTDEGIPIVPPAVQGDLSIETLVAGKHAEADKSFTCVLKLTLGNIPITGTFPYFNGASFGQINLTSSGTALVTLKDNEKILIKNLPQGAFYTITPYDYTDDGYWVTGQTGSVGTVASADAKKASFTYTRKVGSLCISNTVKGSKGDKDKKFKFTVTFSGSQEKSYACISSDGTKSCLKSGDTISLAHGQHIIIEDIPEGIKFSVSAFDYSEDGYRTSAVGAAGSITDGINAESAFTNTVDSDPVKPGNPADGQNQGQGGDNNSGSMNGDGHPDGGSSDNDNSVPPTGDDSLALPYLLFLLLSVSGLIAAIKRKRR